MVNHSRYSLVNTTSHLIFGFSNIQQKISLSSRGFANKENASPKVSASKPYCLVSVIYYFLAKPRLSLILFCFLEITFPLVSIAEEITSKHAAEVYRSGQYKTAVVTYQHLLNQNPNSANLHYNLANAYYRSGKFGHAVGHFRAALNLQPRFPAAKQNLYLARQQIASAYSTSPKADSTYWLMDQLGYKTLAYFLILVWACFWLCILARTNKAFTFCFLVLSLVFGHQLFCSRTGRIGKAVAGSRFSSQFQQAVVLEEGTKAFSSASPDASVISLLASGEEIEFDEIQSNWLRVYLPQQRIGWVNIENLLVLN